MRLISPTSYEKTVLWVVLAMFFASMPDIDGFFGGTLADHHKSPLHKPIFWVGLGAIGYILSIGYGLFPSAYITIIMICVGIHLITDTITARTTGIAWLYPIIKKEYSLYTMDPSKGNFNIFAIRGKAFREYRKFYFQNEGLVIFEYSIFLLGVLTLIL